MPTKPPISWATCCCPRSIDRAQVAFYTVGLTVCGEGRDPTAAALPLPQLRERNDREQSCENGGHRCHDLPQGNLKCGKSEQYQRCSVYGCADK
ncbi:hypothetical protein AGR1A_Cc20438 [Agrobacterium fabacearum CFBP 5771]|nr:hypothetical protein AGR1A_Cc20438 [Agrobacterium fabacearum CFBP 5771]